MSGSATADVDFEADALDQESAAIDVDALIDPEIEAAIAEFDQPASLLGGMARYHLGQLDANLAKGPDHVRKARLGKRLRPAIALLSCAAQGGDPHRAAPLAAAVELLHNFTLIHDDIQDESETRRHRQTVWSIWGRGQAINAGDALFAAAQVALYGLRRLGVADDVILDLSDACARMTVEIVQGQVLDLGFEGRSDVSPAAYLEMIERKTAAIVRFSAWAGAVIAGGGDAQAKRFAEFGRALGLGFQVRDDLLGIWGEEEVTGKTVADDIRRRKQSLPVIVLWDRVGQTERAELERLYARPEIDAAGVHLVLNLLERWSVRATIEQRIQALHGEAHTALAATNAIDTPAGRSLAALVESLSIRQR